jgi:hypothetical protein
VNGVADKAILKGMVQSVIFCQRKPCGRVLDVKSAVHVAVTKEGQPSKLATVCAADWDTYGHTTVAKVEANPGWTLTVHDGRKLFGRSA